MRIHIEKDSRNIVMEYDKSVVLGIGKVANEDVVECAADGEFDATDVAELLDALVEAVGEDVFCDGLQMLGDLISEKERERDGSGYYDEIPGGREGVRESGRL